jgi:hypothetical protein
MYLHYWYKRTNTDAEGAAKAGAMAFGRYGALSC